MDSERKEGNCTLFKVPKLFGPRPGVKKPIQSIADVNIDASSENPLPLVINEMKAPDSSVEQKVDQPKKVVKQTSQVSIPYEEPSWGGKPGDNYFLEVLMC